MENQPTSCNSRCRSNLCKGVACGESYYRIYHTKAYKNFWFCFEPRSRMKNWWKWKSYTIMIDYWYYLHCTLARWCSGNWRCFGPVFSVISCSGREMQGGVARCYAASQCNLLHDWMVSRTCTHLVKLRLLFNRMLQALQIMALTVPEHTTNQNARMVKKEVRVHRTCTVQVTYPFLQVDHTAFDWKAVPTRAQHPQIRSRSYCKDNPGWAYSREAVVLFMTMTMTMIMAMMATMMATMLMMMLMMNKKKKTLLLKRWWVWRSKDL